jgi:hypothetical protein
MPEYPNLLKGSHAYHLDVFRDHHPLVRDWARRHRLELMINWKNIERGQPLNRIKPLE